MMFDAHVHMGYYTRHGFEEPWYYSLRRMLGVLDRCHVREFVVSSTCAQVDSITIKDLNREAREAKRLAGRRAHVFLWVSGHVLHDDPQLKVLGEKQSWGDRLTELLYEGIKLHEMETPWVRERRRDLMRILAIADERGLPVQFHSASDGACRPVSLARCARRFPNVRFDFAHCTDMSEMAKIIADHPNVWADTAYLPLEMFQRVGDYDWHGRLMFGTDLPVWQAHEDCGLTERYRQYVSGWGRTGLDGRIAFLRYVKGVENE